MTPPPQDTARADARRNRAKVLAAASHAFDEHGTDISLAAIARRAGVGAGTVYRHFPSKEILLEAVLVRQVDEAVAAARRWAADADPVAAFFGFLLEIVDSSYGRKHACDALTAETNWPRPGLAASAHRFHQALDDLLRAAQHAGGVRPDVEPADVTALTAGCATIRASHPDPARGARTARLALESLRTPGPGTDTSARTKTRTDTGTAVTKDPAFRYTAPRCAECGTLLTPHPTGRPARYCGPTCRQRAHRRRPRA